MPRRLVVRVGWGHVTLDFTEAVITQPVLDIDLDVRSGTLTLLTRPGVVIDADDVAVRSSGSVKIRVPPDPAGPVALRIVLSGTVQTGHLRARQRRQQSPAAGIPAAGVAVAVPSAKLGAGPAGPADAARAARAAPRVPRLGHR